MRIKELLCALLAAAALHASAQQGEDTAPNLPEHYAQRVELFNSEAPGSGHIVFLGDSITEGGAWGALLGDPSVINRGISGDNSFGVLRRLDEVVRLKPAKLFLLIGVNDLSKNIAPSVVTENISAIVKAVKAASPATRIYVQSLLPVDPGARDFMRQFDKGQDILDINAHLRKDAQALDYTFVDLYAQFVDARARLDPRFGRDGLHLNEAGYRHWVDYLKTTHCL